MKTRESSTGLAPSPVLAGARYAFADALRGLAALWVVLFHLSAGAHLDGLKSLLPAWIQLAVFDYGYLGVAAFFVLSGFVMALNVSGVVANVAFAGRFIARRLIRLTPPYYFAILLSIVWGILQVSMRGSPAHLPDAGSLLAHAFYLQGLLGIPQINGVLWTLCVEVQFYLAFALLLVIVDHIGPGRERVLQRASVTAVTGALALLWPLGVLHGAAEHETFLPFWYSFAAGVLVCWGAREKAGARWIALAYCAALVGIALYTAQAFVVVVAGTALLLFSAMALKRMDVWLDFRWARFLGTISYSLYLIHNNVIGGCFFLARRVLPPGLALEFFGTIFALTVTLLVSWIAYRLIERPCIEWSRRVSMPRQRPGPGGLPQPIPVV